MLLSEYSDESNPINRNRRYVERDRLTASIPSKGVILVEGMMGSGTNHTIKFAQEYGRNIYVYWPQELVSNPQNPDVQRRYSDFVSKSTLNQHLLQNPEGYE